MLTIDHLFHQCIDPTKVGQRLLEEYATNKSGTLTREEFMVLADLIMRHYEEGYARTVCPSHNLPSVNQFNEKDNLMRPRPSKA